MNSSYSYDSEQLLELRNHGCDRDSFLVELRVISLHFYLCLVGLRFSRTILSFLCHYLIYALPHPRNWINVVDLNSIYG